jgi:uncharacterized protein YhdP
MNPRRKQTFLWIALPIVIVASLGFLFVHYVFDPALYKRIIQESLTRTLGKEVSIGKARISLWEGVGVTFEDFRIRDGSGAFDLLHSKKVLFKARLLPLLRREVEWKRIVLEGPTLRLCRNPEGQFNLFEGPLSVDETKGSPKKVMQALSTLFGGSLSLTDGHLIFIDQGLDGAELKTEIQSFDLQIPKVSYRDSFPFRLSGKMGDPKREGGFSISGTLRGIPEDFDLSRGTLDAKVEVKDIEVSRLWPYLKQWLPMKNLSGTLSLNGQYRGGMKGVFKANAKINLREVVLDWPQVFSFVHTPKWLNLSVDADFTQKEIKVPQVSVELPEIRVRAKGRIYGIGTQGMGMEAEAQSDPFDLSDGRRWIPYRVITPEVSNALFRAEGSGPVQILSVNLSGGMPEIDHCDELKNAHVLSVELKLNGVRLKLPWNLPVFEGMKGNLSFRNGQLNLNKIEGRIFHSTLEGVQGVFSDLLQTSTLQFRSQGRFDLTDLPLLARTDLIPPEVSEALSAFQFESGKADYQLSVKGVIKPPYRFYHQGSYFLTHARLSHRQIPFPLQIAEGKFSLSSEDLRWSEARVDLGQSSLVTNGSWRHGDRTSPVEALIKGRVDLRNGLSLCQSPLFPGGIRSMTTGIEALTGTGQLSLQLKILSSPSLFSYEGELILKEASLRQKAAALPLLFKEGVFSFSTRGIGFSGMRIQCLNSYLILDGDLKDGRVQLSARGFFDLKNVPSLVQFPLVPESVRSLGKDVQDLKGEADVLMRWQGLAEDWINSLKEGQARLRGVSLSHASLPLPLSQIEGTVLLSPEQFRFQAFRGRLGETQVMASITIPRTPAASRTSKPKGQASFQIVSPFIDLDLFFPRKEDPSPASFEGFREWLAGWEVGGKVEAAQVRYEGLFYQEFKMGMNTEDEWLHISPFQLKGAGGDFWGEGWFQPLDKGIRFDIKPRVSNMEARAFMRILSPRFREGRVAYSGRVHIDKVEIRGEGEDFQKVKESLEGSLRIQLENGAIEKSNVLSKVFSILNVSQYFQGRLPDLKTKGLPFHQVVAHFQIKGGVATTEDFLVDSDAMRITGIGRINLAKNEIDAKVGVHPLVTVDTVLSKIPIAGYIFTGKNRAFLSYVYEVKGDLDDPKVEAIPIKSLGEGVFGIIKRLLETPIRPFQKLPSSANHQKNEKN